MRCVEAASKLSWFLDGEAPEVGAHVAECAVCRAKLESLRKADALLAQAAERFAPAAPPKAGAIAARVRRRSGLRRFIGAAAAVLVAGFLGSWIYVNVRQPDAQEVLVFGAEKWVEGERGTVRVVVRDGERQMPVAGARVAARLGAERAAAVSGPDGSVEISLPASAGDLEIDVRSEIGHDTLSRRIAIDRPVRVMLSTDKPIYQPAQTIHLRSLAMNNFTMKPFVGEVVLEVEDPNGNRIFKRALQSSEFGIASADFDLADEVLLGTWRIKATAGTSTSERTVEVKRYVLPKFKVDLRPDRPFYAPGGTLRADLDAQYTFGKPVAGAGVQVELSSWIGEKFELIQTVKARTDGTGKASIEAKLPPKLYGIELEQGNALLRLEATVTDGAGHVERKAVASVAAREPIRFLAFPESGEYVPGVPGRMYVVVSYPDGTPARATVEIGSERFETDETGVVLAPISGSRFNVRVRDPLGNIAERGVDLDDFKGVQNFILRTDASSYVAGGTMQLHVLSATEGVVYVDLVKSGQTLLTKSIEVRGGDGKLVFDLPAELFGAVRVTGYRIRGDGTIMRDSRLVVVDLPGDLQIRPTLKKDPFEPGEEMEVSFEVLDARGKPVVAALGLAVVDEAVFALHESRPGLEKVYFQIEEELLKPRVQIKGVESLAVAASARLAAAPAPEISPLATAFYSIKLETFQDRARAFNGTAGMALIWLVSLTIVVGLCALVIKQNGPRGLGEIVISVVIIGILAALLLPAVARKIRRSKIGDDAWLYDGIGKKGNQGSLSSPRIREHFPETLYWNPQLITDEQGRASLKIPGADSITTWRMAMSAVARDGRLGSGERGLRVFQPFFVDLDLPVALTQGDQVWLPVAVYNYLEEPQTVTLTFEAERGFEVVGEREKKIDVKPGDVTSVRFHLRAREFGRHALTVKAVGTKFSDAVRRSIDVFPDGKEIPISISDRVTGKSRTSVRIPADAIDGASRLWVRLFPSTFSEIVTGLEGLVRMPYG